MKCKICPSEDVTTIYNGPLRTGRRDGWTEEKHTVYKCNKCQTIWHNACDNQSSDYYESTEYRERIEKSPSIEEYYDQHDEETLFKLKMTGTKCFRNKIVADIGCGGGSFLDMVQGLASEVIAIEPSVEYQKTLSKKYHTYSYASDAMNDWKNRIDIVTIFDVIEHVPDPKQFLKDTYDLLSPGGQMFVGTPTDYPILREMLGDVFNSFVFSIHHPWVLSENILKQMSGEIGFVEIDVKPIQRFGLGNLLSWLNEKKPMGDVKYDFISETMNEVYMNEAREKGYGEYLLLTARKP